MSATKRAPGSTVPRPRTYLARELDGRYRVTIDGVYFMLSEFQFKQLAEQVLDKLQAIVGNQHKGDQS